MNRRIAGWLALGLCFAVGSSLAAGGCGDQSASGTGSTSSSTASLSSSTGSSSSSTSGTGGAAGTGGAGTGGSGGKDGGAGTPVALQFEGRVGAKVFSCTDTYTGLGTPPADVKLSDYRFYVHDVQLHRSGGSDVPVALVQDGLWQYQNVTLLDFEDRTGSCVNGTPEKNGVIHGTVPAGSYDGVSFKLGVPFALNHADVSTAPSPLNLSGLFWDWNYGYKFLRVDSATVGGDGGAVSFLLHLGSTGCIGDFADGGVMSCDRPNVTTVTLTGFDPTKNKIVADYAAVVAGSNLALNQGGPPGCMSDPTDLDCPPVFQRLGIHLDDGSIHPDEQKLFHVE